MSVVIGVFVCQRITTPLVNGPTTDLAAWL